MIALHGLGGTGANFRTWAGFDAIAEREGILAVYPDAIEQRWSYGRAIANPTPRIGGEEVDDVGFIHRLIDELVAKWRAEPKRIYVSGPSRGGLMTFTLACALSERIAAAAPIITGMTDHQRAGCSPAKVVPLVLIAGTNDTSQVYDGWLVPAGRLLSVPETMEFWRTMHGCTAQTGRLLPKREATDRTNVAVIDWQGCRVANSLRFYRVQGGGHQIPSLTTKLNPMSEQRFGLRNRDIESAEEIWSFVKNFELASPN